MKLQNPVLEMYARLHNLEVPDGVAACVAFAHGGSVFVLGNVAPAVSIEILEKAISAIKGDVPAPAIPTSPTKAN